MDEISSPVRESRLERYLDYLNPDVEGKTLTKKQSEYFELMQLAYHWRSTFFSPDQVRKRLMKEGDGRGYSSACQIYSDMEYVYGKSSEINKDALKRIQVESYHKLIQMIYKSSADEWDKATRIGQILDKISKLYGLENSDSITADMVMPSRPIQIVSTGKIQIAQVNE
jgi:hypothetical protein